jgi:NADPH:quinone reductase-like Zn-dependent oxidoreductase
VRADHTVLINAVGGVVGSAALQIVKLHGARVIASASSYGKLDRAKALGADAVVNYSSRNLRGEVLDLTRGRGVDLVIESVGGDVLVHSIAAVCDNGRLVTCGAHAGETVPINIVELFRKHMTIHGVHLAGRREIAHVLALVAEGNLKPVIDSVHPLKDIQIAAAKTANREAFGKMVLVP